MQRTGRHGIAWALALLGWCLASGTSAQSYPNRAVRTIVPFAGGSGSDIVGRLLAEELRKAFNQSFVVDNRPGGSAQIAAELVARSMPDGYTLLLTTNTAHSANPFLFKSLRYDPVRDFTLVARTAYVPYILVVRPDSGISSGPQLVQRMRTNPGRLNYGYGNSTSQVASAAFAQQAGANVAAIPYKSMPSVLTDLLGGRRDFAFVVLTSAHGGLKGGQLKPIAFTLAKRFSQMPEMPTVPEIPGFAGYEVTSWIGLVGPPGMLRVVVDTLKAEINRILARREVRKRLAELDAAAAPGSTGCCIYPAAPRQLAREGHRCRHPA